ncbi:MAG: hypothetical protein ACE362_16935 [Phaeodactylibacter xiamenensis]|uniref:Uncharacterized protein n=1 Tax=Phaeodactylibacter xiamenensis TaxID=1524460 RepID=A0A098S6Z0_9BACT|nr:hypothetical protein [Phaeodactylibacter xiamenensis]KGE88329.1 hypothetical protein IX84_08985 [Phaeodactylibacter xiamenensis]MCR9054441.1 hypothetical protein [bacterium]
MTIAIPDLIAIFLSGFGILLCLVVGVQLLVRKEGMRQYNLLLGVLLILYALTLSNGLFAMAGIYAQYQFLYSIPINFSLSLGPLFYFFVRSRVQPSFRLQRRHLPHLSSRRYNSFFICRLDLEARPIKAGFGGK